MKKKLKTVMIGLGIGSALVLSSCGGSETNHDHSHHPHEDGSEHVFACPMHPEVTGKVGDKCPKCGMELEHNDNAGKSNGQTYLMKFLATPTQLEVGKEGVLSFTPQIKGKENQAVPLDIVHEKKLHLIVASKDLSYFEHIHPEYQEDGSYQINVLGADKTYTNGKGQHETKFDVGGDYMLFADYAPTGGTHQLEKIPLSVKGTASKKVTYSKENLSVNTDGYTVSLVADGGKWLTNQAMHIKAVIKKGNQDLDANSFENYLDAKSHMVVLRTETFEYLHVHPEVENGALDLHTTFEKEGIYRGWLQFKIDGKVHTADFVLDVKKGSAETKTESHDSHSHEEHTHQH